MVYILIEMTLEESMIDGVTRMELELMKLKESNKVNESNGQV